MRLTFIVIDPWTMIATAATFRSPHANWTFGLRINDWGSLTRH